MYHIKGLLQYFWKLINFQMIIDLSNQLIGWYHCKINCFAGLYYHEASRLNFSSVEKITQKLWLFERVIIIFILKIIWYGILLDVVYCSVTSLFAIQVIITLFFIFFRCMEVYHWQNSSWGGKAGRMKLHVNLKLEHFHLGKNLSW